MSKKIKDLLKEANDIISEFTFFDDEKMFGKKKEPSKEVIEILDKISKKSCFEGQNGIIDRVSFEDGSEISTDRKTGKLIIGKEKYYGPTKNLKAFEVLSEFVPDMNEKIVLQYFIKS